MLNRNKANVHIVAADHQVREDLIRLFRSAGISAHGYASPSAFLDDTWHQDPGCLLLDIHTPEGNGLETYAEMVARGVKFPVVFVSAKADVSTAVAAMKMGAADFIELPGNQHRLVHRARELLRTGNAPARRHTLTAREREILPYLLERRSSKEIARTLDISHRTVEVHRSNILRKFGISSVAEMISGRPDVATRAYSAAGTSPLPPVTG